MLRQSIYGRLAGYEDVNDAERLRADPAMRRVVGGRAQEKEAASTSEMSRFETEMLSPRENLTALMNLSGAWIDSVQECAPRDKLILDMDSSESETYGEQQGSAYNGYFECTCYHPLFLFNQHGDLERAMLRRGNHASAKFGGGFCSRSSSDIEIATFPSSSAATRPSPSRGCTACWRRKISSTPFASQPTTF